VTTEDDWGEPVNLVSPVNSSGWDVEPTLSHDGLYLYFTSNRSGGIGGFDLWRVDITDVSVINKLPDFNLDGNVDFKDFSYLAYYWSDFSPAMDIFPPLFGDGIIDFKDVCVFAENWLLSTMQASNPNPADDATGIGIEASLNWTPADEAALHEVYFGSDLHDLPLVATQPVGQDSYDPPGELIPGTTYYWWIDEVNDAGPPPGNWPGVLWSFTTVSGEAQCQYPVDGAVIPGDPYPPIPTILYTELIFGPGPTAVKHTGYLSKDPDKVVNRAEDANLGPPPLAHYQGYEYKYFAGHPVFYPFEGLIRGQIYYWTVDETDSFGNVYPGDVWEFAVQDGAKVTTCKTTIFT
jgi:hypothetical protein